MNDALSLVKNVTCLIVSAGVGAVVGNAIKASTPEELKILQKISIGVGGFVLSGMVGNFASKYTDEQIDSTVSQFTELKDLAGSFRKKKTNN